MSLPVVILAGGLAKRMRPLTETVPKSLLPVAGRPFLDWQLDLLKENGIQKVVICAGYLGSQIEDYVSGRDYGMEILFSFDGECPLGTGGAVKKAVAKAGEAFFVLYGDSYLRIDFEKVEYSWRVSDKAALMTVFENDNRWDASNVQYVDGKILCYSKLKSNGTMHYIDYGLGILTAASLQNYGRIFDLADVYSDLAKNGGLAGYEADKRFYEIGTRNGWKKLEERMANKNES